MNRPFILRAVIAVIVIAVFAYSIHPIKQRDFYETFKKLVTTEARPNADKLIGEAKALGRQSANMDKYPSELLLIAATRDGVKMDKMLPANQRQDLADNRDVISEVRKAAAGSIRLGLDLAGGVEFIVHLQEDDKTAEHSNASLDKAIEIIRARLEQQKIFEAEIAPIGSEDSLMISIKAPVVSKEEKVNLRNLIEMSAKLRFSMVHPDNDTLAASYVALANEAAQAEFLKKPELLGYTLMQETKLVEGQKPVTHYYFVADKIEMDGKDIVEATPTKDHLGQRQIALRFNSQGAEDFGRVTKENVGRSMAIVLDEVLYCAPRINEAILGGSAQITGSFSNEELINISNALVSGSFPYLIQVTAVYDTDPKLGADNVQQSIYAGLFALALVVIFMIVYYLYAGLIAVIALSCNVVLVLGALAAFDATLTLPGIAGIVLTIGMAVDANVLIFERIREELKNGKGLRTAVDNGYNKAFSAVFDANITTLFIAVILGNVGTGAIKGFAVTLGIGILTSLFAALFITRLLFDLTLHFTNIGKLPMLQFFRNPQFKFLSVSKPCMAVSILLILGSIAVFAVKGDKVLGIDFTGGSALTYAYQEQVPVAMLEKTLNSTGIKANASYKTAALDATVKHLEIQVRGTAVPAEQVTEILNTQLPKGKFELKDATTIGGLVGWQFSKTAMWSLALAFLGIIAYVTFRYEFSYSIAAVLALLHDVIIASGIFVLLGREFSLPVVAAVLTIIGYSINDTIVIFDRIRENAGLHPELPYRDTVNLSINDTLNRTLLTSITTAIVVVVLMIAGGAAINDFVLVMLLGIVIGTYSSVFVSSSIVAVWHKKIGRK